MSNQKRFNSGSRIISALTAMVFLILVSGCGGTSDLEQGRRWVAYMTTQKFLKESSFRLGKSRTPSGFVKWMFSDWGKAEWPGIKPDDIRHDITLKQKIDATAPQRPLSVAFLPDEKDSSKGVQIVVRGDDDRGMVIIEGYVDPSRPPVFTEERTLPDL